MIIRILFDEKTDKELIKKTFPQFNMNGQYFKLLDASVSGNSIDDIIILEDLFGTKEHVSLDITKEQADAITNHVRRCIYDYYKVIGKRRHIKFDVTLCDHIIDTTEYEGRCWYWIQSSDALINM